MLKDPLWGNRPVKEVKRALNKASIVLPIRTEIEVTVEEKKNGRDREPLLGGTRSKAPIDTLEYEDEETR